jgi:hypothetical protein
MAIQEKAAHQWVVELARALPLKEFGTGGRTTSASYNATFPCSNEHKRLYALQQLELWAKNLSQAEGIVVKGLSLKASRQYTSPFGNLGSINGEEPWLRPKGDIASLDLQIELQFEGAIDIVQFDAEMGRGILGSLQTALAHKTIAEYPLPFSGDLTIIGPLTMDGLAITNTYYRNAGAPVSTSQDFAGGTELLLPRIADMLKPYPLQLGIVLSQKRDMVVLQVIWTEAVSDERRREIRVEITRALEEKFKGWSPSLHSAHFMIW